MTDETPTVSQKRCCPLAALDWLQMLLQIGHRAACIGWVLVAAALFVRLPGYWRWAPAAVCLLALLAGASAALLAQLRGTRAQGREAVGLLIVAGLAFAISWVPLIRS